MEHTLTEAGDVRMTVWSCGKWILIKVLRVLGRQRRSERGSGRCFRNCHLTAQSKMNEESSGNTYQERRTKLVRVVRVT